MHFDNVYKLNREDEDYPKGETIMANLYSDNGLDDLDEVYDNDFDTDDFYDDDFEDEEYDGPFYDPQDGEYWA